MISQDRLADSFVVCGVQIRSSGNQGLKGAVQMQGDAALTPQVLCQFPPFYSFDDSLHMRIADLCFPSGANVFSHALEPIFYMNAANDSHGQRLYLFCIQFYELATEDEARALRKANITNTDMIFFLPKVICLISHFPYYNLFKEYIKELFINISTKGDLPVALDISSNTQRRDTSSFLINALINLFFECPVPPHGCTCVRIAVGKKILHISQPSPNDLPLFDFDLRILFNTLNPELILDIMRLILCEQQILFVSSSLSLISIITQCLIQLCCPFEWEGVYVPLIPKKLLYDEKRNDHQRQFLPSAKLLFNSVPFIFGMERSQFGQLIVEESSEKSKIYHESRWYIYDTSKSILPHTTIVVDIDNRKIVSLYQEITNMLLENEEEEEMEQLIQNEKDKDIFEQIPQLPKRLKDKLLKLIQENTQFQQNSSSSSSIEQFNAHQWIEDNIRNQYEVNEQDVLYDDPSAFSIAQSKQEEREIELKKIKAKRKEKKRKKLIKEKIKKKKEELEEKKMKKSVSNKKIFFISF
ncbi:MAG: hypothetical protein EZS28_019774 [Streblomastix strix]|uniref:UDENN domain-containing protein n=1 Tax=Streblomastix strix TaxID=222440 RepID=A0A5J4VQD5_9EUKA|nr:MAG: hypothetical protein EZS28_019774 [Streblomastix strix]